MTKASNLKIGDRIRLVGGLWDVRYLGYEVTIIGMDDDHRPYFYNDIDECNNYVDDTSWPFELLGRHLNPKDIIFKTEFGKVRNSSFWTANLHKHLFEEAANKAFTYIRYNLREWPYNRQLMGIIDEVKDEVLFYWSEPL